LLHIKFYQRCIFINNIWARLSHLLILFANINKSIANNNLRNNKISLIDGGKK